MFTDFIKKNKPNDKRYGKYPCNVFLHNALRFITEHDYDNAYDEICWALRKAGDQLTPEEIAELKMREPQ